MNGKEYRNAFGKAPDSFKNRVAFTLSHVEEERKVKKFSARLVLIVGIILILMAGVVYAASTEWKVLDLIRFWYKEAPSEKIQKLVEDNTVSKTIDAGEFEVTLEEGLTDGRVLYLTASVRMKNGEDVYFLPMNTSSFQKIGDIVGTHFSARRNPEADPLEKGRTFTHEMETPASSGDSRSFRQAALEDGKRMINILMWVRHGNTHNEMTSFIVLPDGSVSFIMYSNIITKDEALNLELNFMAREVNQEGNYEKGSVIESIPVTIPVMPMIEKEVFEAGGIPMVQADVLVDRVILYLTPLTLHYELYFSSPGERKKGTLPEILFEFLDEQDKWVYCGIGWGANTKALDDTHFVQTGTLQWEKMPDKLTICGYTVSKNERYGEFTLAK